MTLAKFKHVKISGITCVVPEKEICIFDEGEYFDNNQRRMERLKSKVGIYKRRSADKNTTPCDMAINAAENLLKDLKIDKNTIDAIVYVVHRVDFLSPSNAYYIHKELGLSDKCIATDINQACSGWVYGLYLASHLLELGFHKRVLLIGSDIPALYMDKHNVYAHIFGDAASATLLEYSDEEVESFYNIETESKNYEGIISPLSGVRLRLDPFSEDGLKLIDKVKEIFGDTEIPDIYVDGPKVFEFARTKVPSVIKALLEYANKTPEDISSLCLHQANKQIIQSVGTHSGFDLEKVPYDAFENFGNTTISSIPLTISMLDKNIDKECICCCGYGSGLSIGGAVLNLKDTYISEIKDFVKLDNIITQEEYITYWAEKLRGEEDE